MHQLFESLKGRRYGLDWSAEGSIIDWVLILSIGLGSVLLVVLLIANYRKLFLLPPRTLYKLLTGRRVDGEETQSLVDAVVLLAFISFLAWYLLR